MTGNQYGQASTFSVFRNRSFSLLWVGQLICGMGTALTTLAASVLVFRLTGTALSVGLMLMATAAPTILVGLLAGVFVDRYDRKRILVTSHVLRALLMFLIPVLVPLNVLWLYALVALSSATARFFESAQASVLPELASEAVVLGSEVVAINSPRNSDGVPCGLAGWAMRPW